MKRVNVLVNKEGINPALMAGTTTVIIDVFLATTTMVTLMDRGVRHLYPVMDEQEAYRTAATLDRSSLIFGGEKHGKPIEGFDRGVYPDEYPESVVRNKDVIFLTSNGTKAARLAGQSDEILLACLRNAPAVVAYLNDCLAEKVNIVCSGSGGLLNLEDFTCAAYIMDRIYSKGLILNDAARVALEFGQIHRGEEKKMLEQGKVGQYLIEHGEVDLIDFAADIGSSANIPFLTADKPYLQLKGHSAQVG